MSAHEGRVALVTDSMRARIPLQRFAEADEIAAVISFLAGGRRAGFA